MIGWKNIDKIGRDLKKHDILRVEKSELTTLYDYGKGKYLYAVCTGGGFGCCNGSRGSAIFVEHVTTNFNEVMKNRYEEFKDSEAEGDFISVIPIKGKDRWEREWGILEVMVDE